MHIHSYNFQFVMPLPAMSSGLRFCASRNGGTGGGGQVHLKCANSMAGSGLSCRKHLVSTGWATSLLLCMNKLRKQSSGHPFLFLLCKGNHRPRAVTIESLLESGCDLCHESARDSCNCTCVKLEASKPTSSGDIVHLGDP